jgi:ubiquinone/menaquinone biosynthesis C-methylase UbiE
MPTNAFLSGEYVDRVPQWHADDSPWKAKGVLRLLARNRIAPRRIGEVGCGTGEVLRQLQLQMPPESEFYGYDIAPVAIELSRPRQNDRLHCRLADIVAEPDECFDVLLILDVLEHQENYFHFLRQVKRLAPYKVFHTVLDLSAQAVLRKNGLTKRRQMYDDLHFFTKETALQTLADEHYEVLDWFYVPRAMHRASKLVDVIRQMPRRVCFGLNRDLAVRLLGGYSLFVLAR